MENNYSQNSFEDMVNQNLKLQNYPIQVCQDQLVPQLGRFFVAGKDLSEGDVVLKEAPFVHALTNSWELCYNCCTALQSVKTKIQSKVLHCEDCCQIFYCCQTCKQADYQNHVIECPLLKLHGNKLAPQYAFRCYLRALQKHINLQQNKSVYSNNQKQQQKLLGSSKELKKDLQLLILDNLERCTNIPDDFNIDPKIRETWDVKIREMEVLSKRMYDSFIKGKINGEISLQQFQNLVKTLKNNMFAMCDIFEVGGQAYGHGLYLLGSFFNHSCSPNCIATFKGSNLIVRALNNIKRGDQVNISYIDLYDTPGGRQTQLLLKKGFFCKCTRCASTSAGTLQIGYYCENAHQGWKIQNRDLSALNSYDEKENCSTVVQELNTMQVNLHQFLQNPPRNFKNILQQYLIRAKQIAHPHHNLIFRIVQTLMEVNEKQKSWSIDDLGEQLSLGKLRLELCSEHLPRNHPEVLLVQYKLGKIYQQLALRQKSLIEKRKFLKYSVDSLEQCEQGMLLVGGEKCSLVVDVRKLLQISQQCLSTIK